MIKRFNLFIVTMTLSSMFVFSTTAISAENKPESTSQVANYKQTIDYDKFSDQLKIDVKDFSLKLLLANLATQSGVEVLFDDGAEEKISMILRSSNIEHGLKNILRGRNFLLRYDNNHDNKKIVTGVMVLPKNATDQRNAHRLLSMEKEGIHRAMANMSLEQISQIDAAKERWQARLDRLPPERRAKLETRIEKRVIARQKMKKKMEDREKKRQARKDKMAAKMKEKRDAAMQHLSDDEKARLAENAQQSRDQMRAQLLQQLENK